MPLRFSPNRGAAALSLNSLVRGPAGPGGITGGVLNDYLIKNSSTNYDASWVSKPSLVSLEALATTGVVKRTGTDTFAIAQVDLTSEVTGLLPGANMANPSTTTKGGVKAVTPVASNWVQYIDTNGTPQLTQPAFSDISGTATNAQLPSARTATSWNGLTITTTTGTLTVTNGKTLSVSNTLTFTGTDGSSVAFGAGGTVAYTNVTTLSSLASIGTITTGVWNGTDIAVADGGTGASTARAAMANLKGVYILDSSCVGVSYTASTSEVTQKTVTIPASAMGANGSVRITAQYSFSGAAGTRTVRVKFGGTTYLEFVHASTITTSRHQTQIGNRNATNSQVGTSTGQTNWGGTTSATVTSAIDTTAAVDITFTMQNSDAGDTSILDSYLVELIVP